MIHFRCGLQLMDFFCEMWKSNYNFIILVFSMHRYDCPILNLKFKFYFRCVYDILLEFKLFPWFVCRFFRFLDSHRPANITSGRVVAHGENLHGPYFYRKSLFQICCGHKDNLKKNGVDGEDNIISWVLLLLFQHWARRQPWTILFFITFSHTHIICLASPSDYSIF